MRGRWVGCNDRSNFIHDLLHGLFGAQHFDHCRRLCLLQVRRVHRCAKLRILAPGRHDQLHAQLRLPWRVLATATSHQLVVQAYRRRCAVHDAARKILRLRLQDRCDLRRQVLRRTHEHLVAVRAWETHHLRMRLGIGWAACTLDELVKALATRANHVPVER